MDPTLFPLAFKPRLMAPPRIWPASAEGERQRTSREGRQERAEEELEEGLTAPSQPDREEDAALRRVGVCVT